MQNFFTMFLAAQGDTGALENQLDNFGTQLKALYEMVWPYILGFGVPVLILWGAYIAYRFIKAKRPEERQEAKSLVKQLVIGVLLLFIIVVGLPMLVTGLASWSGKPIRNF